MTERIAQASKEGRRRNRFARHRSFCKPQPIHPAQLSEIRERREALSNDIRHTERALEEAERVFSRGATDIAAVDLRVAG